MQRNLNRTGPVRSVWAACFLQSSRWRVGRRRTCRVRRRVARAWFPPCGSRHASILPTDPRLAIDQGPGPVRRAEPLPRCSIGIEGDEKPSSSIAFANFPLAHKMGPSRRHRDLGTSEFNAGDFRGGQSLLVAILVNDCGRSLRVEARNLGLAELWWWPSLKTTMTFDGRTAIVPPYNQVVSSSILPPHFWEPVPCENNRLRRRKSLYLKGAIVVRHQSSDWPSCSLGGAVRRKPLNARLAPARPPFPVLLITMSGGTVPPNCDCHHRALRVAPE